MSGVLMDDWSDKVVYDACLRPTICDEVLVQLQDTFNDKDEV